MRGRRGPPVGLVVGLVAVLVGVLVALTGCSGHARSAAPPLPTPPSSPAAPVSDGRPPVTPAARLRCEEPIDGLRRPRPGMRAADDTVALVVRNPQSSVVPSADAPHRRWEKSPLAVRLGRRATVEVPQAWTARVAFTWGTDAQLTPWTTKLVVGPCHEGYGGRPWVVFPGGYSFDRQACVPIRVTVAGRSSVLHVALGRRATCAAQG